MSAVLERDKRFTEPLYTLPEAAEYLRVPRTTFETWVRGYERHRKNQTTRGAPFIHASPEAPSAIIGRPVIPFVGLAEGFAARALKDAGLPIHEIRELLPRLERDIGIDYALASRRLYVEGGRLLVNYAKSLSEQQEMAVFRSQQAVIVETLRDYLQLVTFDRDGYAERLILPGTQRNVLEVDPNVAFGKPVIINGSARMVDVLDRFRAGESPREIGQDFEVNEDDVIEIIRVFYCRERS